MSEVVGEEIARYDIDRSSAGKSSFDAIVYDLGGNTYRIVSHGGGRVYQYSSEDPPDEAAIRKLFDWMD